MAHQSGRTFSISTSAVGVTVACLALSACQTKIDEAFNINQVATAAPSTTVTGKDSTGYVDPMVVSASQADTAEIAGESSAVTAFAQQDPNLTAEVSQDGGSGPANLRELTMQPTAVNAQTNSIFSIAAAPAAVSVETGTNGASIVPADMPSRRIQAAQKSLFSAPPHIQPAGLTETVEPAPRQAVASAGNTGELPLYERDARAKPQRLSETPSASPLPVVDPAEPLPATELARVTETAAAPKRRWLPSLPNILRGGKGNPQR
ncbi:hypothetical protein FE840_012675 [Peteryoungia desertarenae]|uniref:Lipoprotein n=1 Tax=Peteryoungia desertarenae TaxID=1813451 RepID=A0ABX6QPU7_9HYPH|nr:hypothetical protein [Peteryoungia desertarenae]QLF70321.1 hypothetical protein FE840_012675 [Peteryoungia desertarenae]